MISDGTGMWVLQFASPTQAREAAEILETRGIVAEPDRYIPPIEDDAVSGVAASGLHYSWGASDCGFDGFVSKYAGQFTGKGVVAVVDTGVDSSHSFLRGRVLGGYDFIDGDSIPNDGHSHGTHVAGIVIDCVGSTPVSILPVRVLNNKGEGTDLTVAAGIKYAADHGADVINLSLGGGCSKTEDSAVSYAIGKGCLVVAAAGNDNQNTIYSCPAHITTGGTVIVSAGDVGHNKAIFSNYGSSVDLMAPGVGIKATVPGGSFGSKSGTSMATPHAAAAAMLIDLAWGKTLTPAALEKELYSATTYGKWTNSTAGAGFLDLSKANTPSNAVIPGISLSHSSLSLKSGESQTLTVSVTPSGTAVSWSSNNPNVATVSGGKVTAVGPGTAMITAQITYNGTTYQAKCTVAVAAAEVKPGISLSHSSLSLKVGESQTLTASVTSSGTAVSWSSSNTGVAAVSEGKVTAVGPGTATITAQITYNGTAYQAKCTVTVAAAEVKPGISLSHSSLSLKSGESQTLTASVTPGGLAVGWSSSDTRVATAYNGKVTAVGPGTTTVTAKITYNGVLYQARCTVTVHGDEPGEWTTTKLPEKDGYKVETKVQYRFKSKELTQSSQSSLPGWTLYNTRTEYAWGSWSEWINGCVSGVGDNIQVETRQTQGTTTRYYDLYYYKYWNTNYNKTYYTHSASYALARGGTKHTATALASQCTPSQSYDGQQAYWYNGFNLWWIENVRDVTTPGQQYRTRTRTETRTYYYYKWSDWSEWKDVSVIAEDSVQVETRLLYHYVPVS